MMISVLRRCGLSLCLMFGILTGCGTEQAHIPRPRGYPRIEFPERHYVTFDQAECPFTFEYPDYMHVERREQFFDDVVHPCWFNLEAPVFGAKLHCSYSPISPEHQFDQLVSDAFKIADHINQRANYMDEIKVGNAAGVGGLLMEFSGSAASPLHFYLTDSTTHFLKASLYFQTKVVPDSLGPITDFLKTDIAVMINSMTFK